MYFRNLNSILENLNCISENGIKLFRCLYMIIFLNTIQIFCNTIRFF